MARKSRDASALDSEEMFAPAEFLTLEHTAHPKLFENQKYVWEALKQIASYLQFRLKPGVLGELVGKPFISRNVFVGAGTIVEQGAVLKGPAWIGENCHIRSGCYVRENVIVGDGVVMGNSCEFKNCILFDEAQVPHFNYVGDSIVGYHAHLGAGVILSNVKLDHGEIEVAAADGNIATGLTKFGAIVGDRTEIGCNAVINPGSLLGRDCIIYPGANFRGVLPHASIVKVRQELHVLSRHDQKS
jgi:UDP-N-acetylglucosamine diphosphorylase / glucose-1-phosphate thymidylyltransferase / UDP-N-acetylgalactosamine diphosphorylase / glucosamine-1-phosphate N-acetyltransferase / galactosamine-1-phosphate N-acetyltransferase